MKASLEAEILQQLKTKDLVYMKFWEAESQLRDLLAPTS